MHYKRAKLLSGAPLDLQALVAGAIDDSQNVEDREEGESVRRVLSGVGNTNGMLTAKFMQFTVGQKAHFLEKDSDTGDYKLDTTSVPDSDTSAQREFVESITFLALSASHVMFVAALHLGSKALEDHLNWLLKKFAKIATDDYVILADQQSASAEQRLAKHPVDSVTIGAELEFEVVEQVKTQRRTRDRETVPGYKSVRPIGPVADMLGSMIGDWFGDVPLTKALGKDERIKATLKLNYSNRRKSDEGFEMMQKLAVAGRHFDVDSTRVHLHKGGTLRGTDLKVQTPITVRVLDSGLIDEFDLWNKVHSWLRTAIATSIVPQ
ncbi:hypothetical protein NYR97_11480 [Xanthomonas hydrangeae]|uniref:Uncharacterized protein n=1 Tax=Xanthomonas hydrangeae TaxID=2775159 RepID=A0AAU0B4R4_9XANT|nr:hypothetical protein [Xanthomonas hydrangeae]WOB47916.1 hypothetical protein NYR97_11480 [Xanthomonas hydrangeae]